MKPLSHLIIAAIAIFSAVAATPAAAKSQLQADTDSTATYVPGHESWRMYNPFDITLSIGANINTGGKKNSQWFGTRPAVVPQINYRVTGYISRHWGIYGDVGLSIYKTKDDLRTGFEDLMNGMADIMFMGVSRWHLSLGVGGAYRYESRRVHLTPRAGLNFRLTSSKERSYSNKEGDWESSKQLAWLCADTGVEIGYRISRGCSLILDFDYSLPLQDSKFHLTHTHNSTSDVNVYKSRAWGDEFTISIGVKFGTGK
ncbi:MAG: hypothetical protein K2G33_06990 [Duncaniella sp.]|nr:hypothetical protein [Duncaniella sp.]